MRIEKELTQNFSDNQKCSYEEPNNLTVRVYSREFTEAYALALDSQIERQMKKSMKMVADFWFTAWVNAGQPDLSAFSMDAIEEEEIVKDSKIKAREHDN